MNTHLKTSDKKTSNLKNLLFLYFSIFFIWTAYRIFFSLPEWVDEFIAKPIVWIGPLFILRGSNVPQSIKSLKNPLAFNILFGLIAGFVYFFSYTFLSRRFSQLPSFNPGNLEVYALVLQGGIALSTGLIEEILFRRYLLEDALSIFNDSVIANSFVAFLFASIHLPIIIFVHKYSVPATISYLALLAISGFIYGLVYLKNKSLAASTMTHAVWNFMGTIFR